MFLYLCVLYYFLTKNECPWILLFADIREQLVLIERSVNSRENRHTLRVLRSLPTTRKRLNNNVMYRLIKLFFNGRQPNDEMSKLDLLAYVEEVCVCFMLVKTINIINSKCFLVHGNRS